MPGVDVPAEVVAAVRRAVTLGITRAYRHGEPTATELHAHVEDAVLEALCGSLRESPSR